MELWAFWIKLAVIVLITSAAMYLARRRRTLASGLALALIVFAALCVWDEQGRNSELYQSPDRKYVTRVMVGYGMLDGRDSTVIVRRQGSLRWHSAYKGYGYMQDDVPSYPRLEWPDSRHLIIYYHGAPYGPPQCIGRVEDVEIECRGEAW